MMYNTENVTKKRRSVQIPSRLAHDYSPVHINNDYHNDNNNTNITNNKQTKNLRYTFSAKTLKYLDIVQTPTNKQFILQKKNSFQNLRIAVLELQNKLSQANCFMFKKQNNSSQIVKRQQNSQISNKKLNQQILKKKSINNANTHINMNTNMNMKINNLYNSNHNNSVKLLKTKQKSSMGFKKNFINNNSNNHNYIDYNHLPTLRPNTQYQQQNNQYYQLQQPRQYRQFDYFRQTFSSQQKCQSISTQQTNYLNYINKQKQKQKPITKISQYITSQPMPQHFNSLNINPYSFSSQDKNLYYLNQILRASNQKNSLAIQHINASIKMIKCCILQQQKFIIEEHKIYGSSQFRKMFKMQRLQKDWNKKTLVLDLDETLIHCYEDISINTDIKLKINIEDEKIQVGINIRPYVLSFLKRMAKKFQIVIFTASHQDYANVILDELDPDNQIFSHRFYRQHCVVLSNQLHVKDLSYLPRDLKNLVLVDNAAYSYSFQLDNGIPILPYYQGKDYQLIALEKYLDKLVDVADVREINKNYFKLNQYTEFQTAEELVAQIYINPSRRYYAK